MTGFIFIFYLSFYIKVYIPHSKYQKGKYFETISSIIKNTVIKKSKKLTLTLTEAEVASSLL